MLIVRRGARADGWRRQVRALIASILAGLAAGCTMSVPEFKVRETSSYPGTIEKDGLIIAVHPTVDAGKMEEAFRVNLVEKGLLPVLLVADNRSPAASFILATENITVAERGANRASDGQRAPVTSEGRAYPGRPRKIDLRVALRVTPEFRASKWERKDCCVMLVGPSLASNAEELARHVFREVVVLDGDATAGDVDATLTPRLVYIARTMGACGPCESIIALKVEWRLARADGRPVWVDTVGGQATGSTGGSVEKPLQAAIEDLLLRSERAMMESRAVLHAAGTR